MLACREVCVNFSHTEEAIGQSKTYICVFGFRYRAHEFIPVDHFTNKVIQYIFSKTYPYLNDGGEVPINLLHGRGICSFDLRICLCWTPDRAFFNGKVKIEAFDVLQDEKIEKDELDFVANNHHAVINE